MIGVIVEVKVIGTKAAPNLIYDAVNNFIEDDHKVTLKRLGT